MSSAGRSKPWADRLLVPGLSWTRIGHHLRASSLTILLVSALVMAGEYFGWFDQFEKGATDWLARQRRFANTSEEIVVVGIGEKDYRDPFKSTSPLPADPLLNVMRKLVQACPAVIGIDIVDAPHLEEAPSRCKTAPRIIYAKTAKSIDVGQGRTPGFSKWFRGGEIPEIELEGSAPTDTGALAIPIFPMDRDGMVRAYARVVRAVFSSTPQPRDVRTLNAALVEEYCEVMKHRGGEPEKCRGYEAGRETFLFGRWGENHLIPLDVSEILRDGFENNSASLKNKIVLVGGKFSAARDSYATPNGSYYGVDLLALAVDSDLNRYGISEIEPWLALIWDLLIGASIVLLFAVFRPVPAFWTSVAGTFFLAVVVSALLFHVRSYALNFMVVGIGIIIHQLFVELEKLKELETAHERIRALEARLATADKDGPAA